MDFIPDDKFQPDPQQPLAQSQPANPQIISNQDFVPDEEKYGSVPQQALTVAENAAKGFAGPLATLAEKGLTSLGVPGLTPEAQAGREAANPWEAGLAQAGGLGAGILTGTGEAALLEGAGQSALKLAGIVQKPATLLGRAGAGALKSAVETSLYQAGDEISKKINDPQLATGSALAHIGLGGLIGAGGGLLLGPLMPVWAKNHGEAVEQGINDFRNAMEGSVTDHAAEEPLRLIKESGMTSGLKKQVSNAPEIIDIAERNGLPIVDGMLSAHPDIQRASDALLRGPSTISSLQHKEAFQQAYDKVQSLVDRTVSSGATEMSETQAGQALRSSLSAKLSAENEPIKALYSSLEPYQQAIPLTDRSTGSLSRNINKIIEEQGLVPGSERYNYVKTFAEGIDAVDNLQKLKNFRTEVGRSAGPLTRDLAGKISEKLNGVEERAIGRFADSMQTSEARSKIVGLLDQVKQAKTQYAQFKDKLEWLGSAIGKKKVYGPQDFIDFVDEMNPQTLAKRLFNENNTEFMTGFAKKFPEEMAAMRGYQRGLIKAAATKEGQFLPTKAIKEVMSLEPEMQKLVYAPDELQTLGDAQKYIDRFPKSFNPSGTAHTSAFREFFEHPTGAAIANLRDFGIQSFIKAFGRAVPGGEKEAATLLPLMGNAVTKNEVNTGAFKHAMDYAMATIKGDTLMSKAVKSVFDASIPVAATMVPEKEHTEKLDKKLKEFKTDIDKYASVGGDIGHYLPNHDLALKATVSNAVNYVNNARPMPQKNAPLDKEVPPSKESMAQFNRLLNIAHQPLSVLGYLKSGQITSTDVTHLKAMFPSTYSDLSQKMTDAMMSHVSKEKPIPYRLKQSLSVFLGQPLDSTMTSASMQAIMNANASKGTQQHPGVPRGPSKATASSMEKTAAMYQTPSQARQASRTKT